MKEHLLGSVLAIGCFGMVGCGQQENAEVQNLSAQTQTEPTADNAIALVESYSHKDNVEDLYAIGSFGVPSSEDNFKFKDFLPALVFAGGVSFFTSGIPIIADGLIIAFGAIARAIDNATCTPSHPEYDTGLCYKPCREGYKGVGPVCWQGRCPTGFKDTGLHCLKPKPYWRGGGFARRSRCEDRHGRGACEKNGLRFYPKCRAGYHHVGCCLCSPNCVDGMKDIGVSCTKKSYGRDVGIVPPKCGFFKDKFSCNKSSSKQCIWSHGHCSTKANVQGQDIPIICPKVTRQLRNKVYERACYPVVFEEQK